MRICKRKSKSKVFKIFVLIIILIITFPFCVLAAKNYTCPSCGHTFTENEAKTKSNGMGRPGDADYRLIVLCPNCNEEVDSLTERDTRNVFGRHYSDEELLNKYKTTRAWVTDICSINDENNNSNNLLNTDAMVKKAFISMKEALDNWGGTSLYSCFVGLGVFILVINFSFNLHHNTINNERKTTEQVMKITGQFVLSIVIIANANNLLKLFVVLFGWVLERAILFKNNPIGFTIDEINQVNIADKLTLFLLREEELDQRSLVTDALGNIPGSMWLNIRLFIPWIICQIGKFGILFSVIKCSIEAMVYGMAYPLAIADCYENIKNSRFMRYTRHIMGSLMQLSIIVLVLFGSQLLINGYVNQIFDSLSHTDSQAAGKVFESLVLLTVIQLSKMVVASSASSVIAHKIFGD